MCGINLIAAHGRIGHEEIDRMGACISHRGPDARGRYIWHAGGYSVAMGHLRLSIIDLSEKGHQPMGVSVNRKKDSVLLYKDETLDQSDYTVIFNGEIYNYLSLRDELIRHGWSFVSGSDTEILVKGYAEWKEGLFERLIGIFSILIFDRKSERIIGARDFPGIKPLYIFKEGESYYFSSELKYFVKYRNITPLKEKEHEFLFSKNTSGDTMYAQVASLEPGTYFTLGLKDMKLEKQQYFSVPQAIVPRKYNTQKSSQEITDQLDSLLNEIVKDQMVADVEVGTICSGGLDSSLITAIAKKYNPRVKIFSLDVEGTSEIGYARMAAKHLGLKLSEVRFTKKDFERYLPEAAYYNDLPLVHPNTVAIYKLSKEIKKQGVTVILSGEGADELFGGYDKYVKLLRLLWLRRFTPKFDLPILLFLKDDRNIMSIANSEIHPKDIHTLFDSVDKEETFRRIYTGLEKDSISASVNAFIVKDLFYYISPLLVRADRATMAAGLEGRVPYLDQRLIDFAVNLPLGYKVDFIHGGKLILKKVAERYLPREIVYRKKKGLPLPLGTYNIGGQRRFFLDEWKKANENSARH